jgi:hypothetical protein
MSERLNVFWFLSLLAPAFIMSRIFRTEKFKWNWLEITLSLMVTYFLCVASVFRKWNLLSANAITREQIEFATTHDGANQVFSIFLLGPVEAIFWTVLWGCLWARYWKRKSGKVGNRG